MDEQNKLFNSGLPVQEAFREFLSWLSKNEKSLSDEGIAYFDLILENFNKVATEYVSNMPDSPDKRKASRLLEKKNGERINVSKMLKAFQEQHGYHTKIIDDWSEVLLATHQSIADFLFDIAKQKASRISVIVLTLLYGCMDELIVAHHLGRHFYFIQANAHLRTVLETIDRVELFIKEPSWIEVWAGSDWRKIQLELGPGAVRKKLEKDAFDPLYGYLSNNGTHVSYDIFRSRMFQSMDKENEARVFVGGTPLVHLQMFHFMFSIIVSNLLLSRVVTLFGKIALNHNEVMEVYKNLTLKFQDFHAMNFKKWALEEKLDASSFELLFENMLNEFNTEGEK